MRNLACVFLAMASGFAAWRVTSGAQITIDTVPVGNRGNANDPATGGLYGGVNYDYRIGTYEVTNAQYAAFLNEKAKTSSLGLYHFQMGSSPFGGISQSGAEGSFTYAVRTNMANKPVIFVS